MTPFDLAFERILKTEGGYVNDPQDRGGETNYGITRYVAVAHGYNGPMKEIPLSIVKDIYRKNYWDSLSLDAVALCHALLAQEVFDSAVNCGQSRAAKWLQQAINALRLTAITVDGFIGQQTIDALKGMPAKDLSAVHKLCDIQQGAHYLAIVEKNPSQKKFIRGWLTRVFQ